MIDSGMFEPWNAPAVLLVDLDAFFASVEQLDHPAWRGKPVIVGGDAHKHGVVSTASYEARAYGVHSAMPALTAEKLCPHAIWTHGHFDRYREVSSQVMAILYDESPRLQQVSIDEAFLDISPTPVNTEHPIAVAQRIQERVAALGVTCSIGLGTTKSVAKIASDMDKPRGLTIVYPGRELDFLSPLPIRTMSGVGARAEAALKKHGIKTLGQLAQAPDVLLQSVWGKNATMMRKRCLGLDESPVEADDSVKSVSNRVTLAEDLRDFESIAACVDTIAAKVGRRLRKKGLAGHTLALQMKYSDRTERSVQKRLHVQCDNEHVMIPLLHAMIDELWKPGMTVRLMGVAVTGFEEDPLLQESLFDSADFANTAPEVAKDIEWGHHARCNRQPLQESLSFEDDLSASGDVEETVAHPVHQERKPYRIGEESGKHLAEATDKVKNRFGEMAVYFGRELHVHDKTTGTAAKNPEDYLK